MSISIHRFAPTPAAKFGLALDLAVLAGSTAAATHGPLVLRVFWALSALIVFWTTSSVAHHYAHAAERAAWEDVVLTLVSLLSVATVLGVGGHLLPGPQPDVLTLLALALPAQVLLRLTVFAYLRARTSPPRQLLIVGTGALGRITGEDLATRRAQCSYLSWPGEKVPEPLRNWLLR